MNSNSLNNKNMGMEFPGGASEEDLADLKMAADLLVKVKKAKGDTAKAEKWEGVAEGLDVDKLSPQSREDYQDASGAIATLEALKKSKKESPEPAESSVKPEAVKEEKIKKESKTKKCPKCGNAINIESQFCNMCGQTFKETDPAPWFIAKKEEEKEQVASVREGIDQVFVKNSGPDTKLENKPDLVTDFSAAESLEDIYDQLREMGGMTYSNGEFNSAERMIEMIELLRGKGVSEGPYMENLTRVGNLRKKVGELILAEQNIPSSNAEGQKIDFSGVRSFEEIYDQLKKVGGLTYSDGQFYPAQKIIDKIESLRRNGISSGFMMDSLTRVGKLRQKVGILIDLERPAPETQKSQDKQEKPRNWFSRWFKK